ncbi:kelch-like protein 24 [Branchiostoma floridae]|uniref:Kelch-like protein 24 n=1 Tax=Branchiostoma floridae TaxID=7739 RepID=A0A9J7MRY9_BRAFL|nr:kelch-like protein 24 [Branchiostoma floridae]
MASAQRSQTSFDFCHDTHSSALLQGLQELRSENMLVDVILCVSGREIPCHRNVLATCSAYFRAMFCNGHLESKEHKVTIEEQSASALQLIVNYAYTSRVTITEDNAVELMEAANFFQILSVKNACTKFLSDSLCVKNCMKMVSLGGMIDPVLEADAMSYAMKEFSAASKTPELLDLTKEQLKKLISSDHLNAPEQTVYTAVMAWINHDTRKRKKEIRELMELVRFPWMDKMYFLEKVETDKTLRKCCPDLVSEVLRYQAFPGEVQSPRTRPRHASGLREAVVVIGGCEKLEEGSFSGCNNSLMMTHSSAQWVTSWVSMTKMNDKDRGFAVAVLGTSDIMVCGGVCCKKDVWLYQAKLDMWCKLAPMHTGRAYCKLAVLQGKVYAIGGRNSPSSSTLVVEASVEVYNQSLMNKWTEGVPLPQPRYHHAVAVVDSSIYVIGGFDAEGHATSTVFHFSNSQWHTARDLPRKISNVTASVLNGSIYVAGVRWKLLCYKPEEDLWTVIFNTNIGRKCGMTVFGGQIYIYGGLDSDSNGTTKILQLNEEDESIEQVATMPKGLFDQACVTILKG